MTNASKTCGMKKLKKIGGNSEKARFFRLLERPNGSRALKLPKDIPWRKIKSIILFCQFIRHKHEKRHQKFQICNKIKSLQEKNVF